MTRPLQLEEIVSAGLCIGCGLCESVAGRDRVEIVTTDDGRERPRARVPLDENTLRAIGAVCPGTRIEGADRTRLAPGTRTDAVWGPIARAVRGHAADPVVRHRAASGGATTALAQFLLDSGRVELVVQVGAVGAAPMRTERRLSVDSVQVLEATGSRYGPAAPLREFHAVLDRGRPFALVGKPCDIGAARNLARLDARVDRLMRYTLAVVCGGASELGKSRDVLDRFGVAERDLSLFRYRGHGNPGMTRIETRDGAAHELTYAEMWSDEATWRIQSRCKICPDAIGEAADVVAGDTWPDATPRGEDAGFNSIVARTRAGAELLDAAAAAGAIHVVGPLSPRQLDDFNPHQVARKRAAGPRIAALRVAGRPAPRVRRLRIARLALDPRRLLVSARELLGARSRLRDGRLGERDVVEVGPAPEPARD
jgi:coenzyme F420 hydrogenase subunit beta